MNPKTKRNPRGAGRTPSDARGKTKMISVCVLPEQHVRAKSIAGERKLSLSLMIAQWIDAGCPMPARKSRSANRKYGT